MKRFIDNVADKVIEYLCDNKTWDMHEVRNIISLHLSQGLEKVLRSEEQVLADKQAALIAERTHPKTTSRRNAQINAELLKLSQGRKAIRSRILQAQDESELVLIKKYLRGHAPDILQDFYKTIPQRQKFAKI